MAGEDTDPKSSASAAAVPYVFLSFLLKVLPQFLVLVLILHMIGSTSYMLLAILSGLDMIGYGSYMQKLFTFSLLERITCFISSILVMLYLVFLLIKSFGKLLIFSTGSTCFRICSSSIKKLLCKIILTILRNSGGVQQMASGKCIG